MEQSYKYYTGNDGSADTKVIPQVWPFVTFYFCMVAFSIISLPYMKIFLKDVFLLKASGAYVFRPNGTYPIKSKAQVFIILQGS